MTARNSVISTASASEIGPHLGTPLGAGDQAVGVEDGQRRAHRAARDGEHGGEIGLHQVLPRQEFAVCDGEPYPVDEIDGDPDHRDVFQSPAQQRANTAVTPCCSRSRSPELVVDI
jgi:hypothetical protein